MKTSENHSFYKPESGDDILTTISNLFNNFTKLDSLIDERTDNLSSFLIAGKVYELGKKVWRSNPSVGSNLGWVNIKSGKYAPTWQVNTVYRTGDLVAPNINNGHIYECIENGTSGLNEPSFPLANDAYVFDNKGSLPWLANYVVSLDNIVFSSDGEQLYYYKCIKAGTTSTTEPVWARNSGAIIDDGSAQWQSYKAIKWKEVGVSSNFRDFGNIV